MRIDVITIFPEYFSGIVTASLLGKAVARGDVEILLHQLRDFTTDRHRSVDDTPYGGGRGMVLKLEPLVAAIEAIAKPGALRVLLTPRGRPFTQARAATLARAEQVVLVCGRYEGVDERIDAWIDERVCIGDYVLSGGEAAAAVVIDAVVRLIPGVVGNRESLLEESFADGLLEHAQYTRPETFRGHRIPAVLLGGNHAEIERWRRAEALAATTAWRPDLLERGTSGDAARASESAGSQGPESSPSGDKGTGGGPGPGRPPP